MSISSRYKDLLRSATTAEKLTLFRFLFDAGELTGDLALALLKIIHAELSAHRNSDRSIYKQYAAVVALLRHHMPDVFQQVIAAWDSRQNAVPEEWFSHDKLSAITDG